MVKKYIQIETTFKTKVNATDMLDALLNAKLVACGQIKFVKSVYNWNGKRCVESEYLLTLKTREQLFDECQKFIKLKHKYELPQITAFFIEFVSAEYANWIDENTLY